MRIAPTIFYILTGFLYIVTPLSYAYVVSRVKNIWEQVYGPWIVVMLIMCLTRLPYYFIVIERIVYKQARAYIQRRALLNEYREMSMEVEMNNSLNSLDTGMRSDF